MLKQPRWRPARLANAISLATLFSASAQAIDFSIGEIDGQLDSTLSIGASWALRNPDPDLLGSSVTDDGRRNFKKGETFSKIFKGIHDLQLSHGDTGVFVRGKYWYDFELKDEQRLWKDIDDSNRKQGAQSSGAEILDAFVYHNYAIGELPGSVRLGKQVVSWGESTFIGNSINAINPIDAAAFRRPGAEIKEGLIPVNMFYLSQSITDQLSAEAFYQLEWDQTVADNCGTFFAGADVVADGCDNNYNILGPSSIASIQSAKAGGFGPAAQAAMSAVEVTDEGLVVPRGGDRDARDDGQFGAALRWMGDEAEYAAYFLNYHSRTPNLSMQNANAADITAALTTLGGALAQPILLGRGSYFLEYPEDIRLYGLSFSTSLPTGTAWRSSRAAAPTARALSHQQRGVGRASRARSGGPNCWRSSQARVKSSRAQANHSGPSTKRPWASSAPQ